MADSPVVSVLLPACNAQRYIREAIDSVLDQTFKDFELILLDDGSTDRTPVILQKYAKADRRVRVQRGENRGISTTLNEGLAVTRGSFIARMDADDVCYPERFAKQVGFLADHPDHVLVGSRCLLIDPGGYPICEKFDIVSDHEQIDAALMNMSWPLVHPAVMMRAESLRKIGGYDPRYRTNQDHDLFLRLAEHGRLANLPDVLLKYRQHLDSVGSNVIKERPRTHILVDIVRAAHERRGIPFVEPDPSNGKPLTLRELQMNWWWWALQAGNRKTARRRAMSIIRQAPFSPAAWRTLFCAIRGH